MNKSIDFIADILYLTTEQGGRKGAAFSGYCPQVKFSFSKYQGGGQQTFINKKIVTPGENVIAEIRLVITDPYIGSLKKGFKFDVMEGSRTVGKGIILEILNQELLAK